MTTVGWLDCASGVSGDMLLGVLVDAGAPLDAMQNAVDAAVPEPVELRIAEVTRSGLRATRVHVDAAESTTHRTWAEIRTTLETSPLDAAVLDLALGTFGRLAEAEARVHGTTPDRVHFHEVGALDAIADIVGAAAGFAALGLDGIHASPVAVGSGTVSTRHGLLPVPAPAVVELLRGIPTYGGGADAELATPTGAALLTTVVASRSGSWGDQPPMQVHRQAFGAGGRDLADRPNVIRLLVGELTSAAAASVVLQANVDDMDPRLWPAVLARLLDAGASDAWLVPILMKKGRPAHTICALVESGFADRVRRLLFTETTTIGVRAIPVSKHALDRTERTLCVDGQPIRVKVATLDGVAVNTQPEYEDVAAAAAATKRPVKDVLAEAIAAAHDPRTNRPDDLGPRRTDHS